MPLGGSRAPDPRRVGRLPPPSPPNYLTVKRNFWWGTVPGPPGVRRTWFWHRCPCPVLSHKYVCKGIVLNGVPGGIFRLIFVQTWPPNAARSTGPALQSRWHRWGPLHWPSLRFLLLLLSLFSGFPLEPFVFVFPSSRLCFCCCFCYFRFVCAFWFCCFQFVCGFWWLNLSCIFVLSFLLLGDC